jgi:Membrane-associated sensor, integral membrane domain/Membrane-associated sensor domain
MKNYGWYQMTASDADSNAAEVTSLSVRVTLLTIFIFGALALLLIPVSNFPGPQMPGFIPLFVAGIFFAQLPTAFFLILWFRRQCRWSLLLLGCTYFYSALMSLSHLLTFPGAILVDQPLVAVPEQSTAWIFAAWTNGFALLALIAVSLEDRFSDHQIAPNRARRAIATALCAVLAAVVIVTLAVAKLELPALVTQDGFTALSWGVRWLSIILLCSGIVLIFVMREPSDLYLWLSWALTAMVFYTVLSAIGGARFSVGWYIGRLSWLVSAWVLFIFFVLQFARAIPSSAPVSVTPGKAPSPKGTDG